MPFRLFFIGLFFFIVFTGCKENGEGTSNVSSIDTVEELSEFVSGLNYVINLPENESFSFIPSRDFAIIGAQEFSTMDNDSGNSGNTLTYSLNQTGKAELKLDLTPPDIIDFNYAICTTIEQISLAFPEANISQVFKDHLLFVATTELGYSNEELILGEPIGVSSYLHILIHPDDLNTPSDVYYPPDDTYPPDDIYPFFGFLSINYDQYYLDGKYILSGNGLKFDGIAINNYSFVDCSLNFYCNAN